MWLRDRYVATISTGSPCDHRATVKAAIWQRTAYFAAALLIAAGAVWLIVYAAGPDDYYRFGDVSRWDHARRWGMWPSVIVAVALSAASVIALLTSAFVRAKHLVPVAVVLTILALCSLPVALLALTAGH